MLKFFYASEADVPEAHKALYTAQSDGRMKLNVTGAVSKEDNDTMRAKVIDAEEKLKDMTRKFDGIDPDKARALEKRSDELDEAKLFKKDDVEGLVTKRTAKMKEESDKALADLTERERKASSHLAKLLIDAELVKAGAKRGLRPEAADIVSLMGSNVFRLEDGKAVAYGPDGKKIYGASTDSLTIEEYLDGLVKEKPLLFDESKGSGAQGGKHTVNHSGANPWSKKSENLTEQVKLRRANPQLAKQLEAQAAGE